MKKNKAVHKGNGLLPYPVIVSASEIIKEEIVEETESQEEVSAE